MERMSSNTLALEESGEPESRCDLILGDLLIPVLRFAHDELADLHLVSISIIPNHV